MDWRAEHLKCMTCCVVARLHFNLAIGLVQEPFPCYDEGLPAAQTLGTSITKSKNSTEFNFVAAGPQWKACLAATLPSVKPQMLAKVPQGG